MSDQEREGYDDTPGYYSRTYHSSRLKRHGDHGARPPKEPRQRPARGRTPRRKRKRGGARRIVRVLVALLVIYLLIYVAIAVISYTKLDRVSALSDYNGRPAATPGQDWLLVGSDSREGLTKKQQRKLHTGHTGGKRADTMMLLHIPQGGGKATLVSFPRDSYVPIPGHGHNKINAAYAIGGGKLLTRTIEQVTGIRLDHYMEIGFGGFVGAVNGIGGVRICVKRTLHDPVEHETFKKGCHVWKGRKALLYVRSRHSSARGDFARVEHQRQFLAALFHKASSPGTILNPVKFGRLAFASAEGITVDEHTGLIDLSRLFLTMRSSSNGGVRKLTVPVAGTGYVPGAGSVVQWDRTKALKLFNQLEHDRKVTVHG
ncbi:MAG: LCP family protein [Streptosporangiales bacterium]